MIEASTVGVPLLVADKGEDLCKRRCAHSALTCKLMCILKGDQGILKVRAPKASWLSIDPITDSANRAEEGC
jgi:hypothetical protein